VDCTSIAVTNTRLLGAEDDSAEGLGAVEPEGSVSIGAGGLAGALLTGGFFLAVLRLAKMAESPNFGTVALVTTFALAATLDASG
jgi:hypothetical protein